MKRWLLSPYIGLILTGVVATAALLMESGLQVSADIHFFLQFVWLGVVAAALFTFALMSGRHEFTTLPMDEQEADIQGMFTAEFIDEDRLWLQSHPDSSWKE